MKRANGHGAFAGAILGMAAVVYASWGTNVAWLYLNVIGPVVVLAVGIIVSLVVPQKTVKAQASPEKAQRL